MIWLYSTLIHPDPIFQFKSFKVVQTLSSFVTYLLCAVPHVDVKNERRSALCTIRFFNSIHKHHKVSSLRTLSNLNLVWQRCSGWRNCMCDSNFSYGPHSSVCKHDWSTPFISSHLPSQKQLSRRCFVLVGILVFHRFELFVHSDRGRSSWLGGWRL